MNSRIFSLFIRDISRHNSGACRNPGCVFKSVACISEIRAVYVSYCNDDCIGNNRHERWLTAAYILSCSSVHSRNCCAERLPQAGDFFRQPYPSFLLVLICTLRLQINLLWLSLSRSCRFLLSDARLRETYTFRHQGFHIP